MSDPRLQDDAALYALGLLDTAEAAVFEQQLAADAEAVAALREYGLAAEAVTASLPAESPPPRLRDRVLGIAAAKKDHRDEGGGAIRASEGRWRKSKYDGITYKRLYVDKAAGLVTMLVRLEPGAILPAHRHARTEQCLIVQGDLVHEGHVYTAGDFTWAEAGSIDPLLTTKNGALLLIIGPPDNEEVPV